MRLRRLPLLIVAAVVLLLGLPSTAVFYTDWLWFREVGYQQVFLKTINAEFTVFLVTFAVTAVFLYVNFRIAQRSLVAPHIVFGTGVDGRPVVVPSRRVGGLALPVALGVALLLGYASTSDWLGWLSFLHATPFGRTDPLFGRDISFYIFRLPMYDAVRQEALLVAFLALAGSGLLYLLGGSVVLEPRYGFAFWPRLRLGGAARRHLALLVAVIFALMAWGAWLDAFHLTQTQNDVIFGASYANVHADLPFLRLGLVVLGAGALLAVWHGFSRRGWPIPAAVGAYIAVLVIGGVYSGFVERFLVKPNELDKESPYIVSNIKSTRQAYDLDQVQERDLSGDASLTAADIVRNSDTIDNVRLWDHQPLLQTFAQIQEIRTYYDFASVDNDRYTIDGKYRQVMLSLRELDSDSLKNPTWVNTHLTFTHGYGLTLGPVNKVTTEGLPVLFIQNLPPESSVNLSISQPAIYYGEMTKTYVLVDTRQQEFDYPKGDDNAYTTYTGTGGVPVGGFWRRLLFGLRFGSTDILVTPQITSRSRVLFHRQIGDRVQLIAPFLQFDADPYPVIDAGRIYWIQDAYTTSANYPYSTPVPDGFNYIRNAVKIVIDAYDGTTTFYLSDPSDPIAQTLAAIFPGMLRPMSEMPAALRPHVRYPEGIFKVQASVFATYHMTNPRVFYNKEDQWQVPVIDSDKNGAPMQPYYTVMKLPDETKAEFIQMLPFTPAQKNNLSAWMVARSDSPHYGQLLSFQFPKQKIIYGPLQIVGRINQDQTISPQVTLWDQQGSQVVWGTLLVIPIEESLLYVRPLYLRSQETRIPELKRVVVAYQGQIVMDDTLTAALAQIFGPSVEAALPPDRLQSGATSVVSAESEPASEMTVPVPGAGGPDAEALRALAAQAADHFEKADQALKSGDLGLYQDEIKKAQATVEKMRGGGTAP